MIPSVVVNVNFCCVGRVLSMKVVFQVLQVHSDNAVDFAFLGSDTVIATLGTSKKGQKWDFLFCACFHYVCLGEMRRECIVVSSQITTPWGRREGNRFMYVCVCVSVCLCVSMCVSVCLCV